MDAQIFMAASAFPYWKLINDGKQCNYCGKSATYISIHPNYMTDKLACAACVEDGPTTPHYINRNCIRMDNTIVHPYKDGRNIHMVDASQTCKICFPKDQIEKMIRSFKTGIELQVMLNKLDKFYRDGKIIGDDIFPACDGAKHPYGLLHQNIKYQVDIREFIRQAAKLKFVPKRNLLLPVDKVVIKPDPMNEIEPGCWVNMPSDEMTWIDSPLPELYI
jgi:hypothetical protein